MKLNLINAMVSISILKFQGDQRIIFATKVLCLFCGKHTFRLNKYYQNEYN